MLRAFQWFCLVFFAISFSAQAKSSKLMLWSDQKGLVEAEDCQPTTLQSGFEDYLEQVAEIPSTESSVNFKGRNLSLSGSFWQMLQTAQGTSGVVCGNVGNSKSYVLFDVFVPELLNPVAQVAVNSNETAIFRSRILHSEAQAEKIISERAQNQPNRLFAQEAISKNQVSAASSLVEGLDVQDGSLQYVVCLSSIRLNVRDDSLNNVLFVLGHVENIKLVQSFGVDRQQKLIGSSLVTFVKVQIPSRPAGSNIGWVSENYVKLTSQCPGWRAEPSAEATSGSQWTFPTIKRPSDSYKTGMRRFRASRSGGRLHAACDLYRIQGEVARAVNSGTVIRDRYYFYEGTYALEVKHTGGRVVRYGEITGKAAAGVSNQAFVSSGQTIGYVGKVNSGCCTPMLHFEMYAGTQSGPLTQSGENSFQRRADLMDPTLDLTKWELQGFGQSY